MALITEFPTVTEQGTVPWDDIKAEWGEEEYGLFMIWMQGQTVIEGGPYIWDVRQYARSRNRGVAFPYIWD